MCGIYLSNIRYSKEDVATKLDSIKFRGPNYTGYLKINDIILGHLRLSVIDLEERSNQPMTRGGLIIVFNGEIYNFKEIKQDLASRGYQFTTESDTEVILFGYKEWKEELLPKMNGMFAFAIYDTTTQKIFCARDRLGVKPFFYYWKDGLFEICSQLRPIISKKSEINSDAVSMFLDCGYVPSPFSILKDVHKLPPGSYLEIDLPNKTRKVSCYWDLKPTDIGNISYDRAKADLHELLIEAVKVRMEADVPLGCFLSGGIDSAIVSSIASKISKTPVNTFTIGFEDPKFNESHIAKEYARIIRSNHKEIICTPSDVMQLINKLTEVFDEPFADSSALPSLLVNSLAKRYVTVALSGDGGDESFFGYNHFDSMARFQTIEKVPRFMKQAAASLLRRVNENKFSNTSTVLELGSREDFIEAIFIGYDSLQKVRRKDWLKNFRPYEHLSREPLQQAADLNIKLWLENDSNVKVDRASMAYSVEIRSPFLDYRVIEFARTLPVSYRFRKGSRKIILKDILKEYIPESVFNQPKMGFGVPVGNWMRNELKTKIKNFLTDDFLNIVPNLNVAAFKLMFESHMAGREDHTFAIWKLFVLSAWYREFNFYKPI